MRKITLLLVVTGIAFIIYKLFWIALVVVVLTLMIRGVAKRIRKSNEIPENHTLWQKWSDR